MSTQNLVAMATASVFLFGYITEALYREFVGILFEYYNGQHFKHIKFCKIMDGP